jgi:hypothetical protein
MTESNKSEFDVNVEPSPDPAAYHYLTIARADGEITTTGKETNAVPNSFDSLLMMCGVAGVVMVVGSILLLYRGVIKLGEKSAGTALEAEFKDQLKINIRNPALGLFAIGFFFFVLALYFAKHEEGGPLVVTAHIKIGDVSGITPD